MTEHMHDHDRGLTHDLELIARQMVARRRALSLFGAAGSAAFLAGCGGGSTGSTGTATSAGTTAVAATTTTATTTTATTTAAATTTTASTGTSTTCTAIPQETAGPYPADGTNSSSGSTSNVLTSSGIVRSDIRSSFISSTTTAPGVKVMLTLTLVKSTSCGTPISGYPIYLWHANATGSYSLYSGAASESYLRGLQVTDANGQVTFTTIFPGAYDGRYPHMHFEVFSSLSAATSGRAALLTSQLAMPRDIATTVYSGSSAYTGSTANLAKVTTSSDGVFGDNTAAQIAQMTPTMSGSVDAGYTAINTIPINV